MICSQCNLDKHEEEMSTYKSKGITKIRSKCKVCHLEHRRDLNKRYSDKNKAYYTANKDRIATNRKIYYENNKESILANAKKYRGRYRAREKAYRENNKESIKENRELITNHKAQKINTSKHRAKTKGLSHNITIEDIMIPDVCPLLGIPLISEDGRSVINSPSLDRIDNTKGYVKGNVWVISNRANTLKGDADSKELFLIATNLEKKEKTMAKQREQLNEEDMICKLN